MPAYLQGANANWSLNSTGKATAQKFFKNTLKTIKPDLVRAVKFQPSSSDFLEKEISIKTYWLKTPKTTN